MNLTLTSVILGQFSLLLGQFSLLINSFWAEETKSTKVFATDNDTIERLRRQVTKQASNQPTLIERVLVESVHAEELVAIPVSQVLHVVAQGTLVGRDEVLELQTGHLVLQLQNHFVDGKGVPCKQTNPCCIQVFYG